LETTRVEPVATTHARPASRDAGGQVMSCDSQSRGEPQLKPLLLYILEQICAIRINALQRVSKMKRNPLKLDEEELRILRDLDHGEFESIQHFRAERHSLEAAARRTLQKDKHINIGISSRDLEKLQKRAVMEGIPYQTLIASTLHKFVTGKLKEPL
jgi:predicted DNA binding CopG/RHH family protein